MEALRTKREELLEQQHQLSQITRAPTKGIYASITSKLEEVEADLEVLKTSLPRKQNNQQNVEKRDIEPFIPRKSLHYCPETDCNLNSQFHSNFIDLPVVLVAEILGYLKPYEPIIGVGLVSQSFASSVNESMLWDTFLNSAIMIAKENIKSLDVETVKTECQEVPGRSRGPRAHFFLKMHALSSIIAAVACHCCLDEDYLNYSQHGNEEDNAEESSDEENGDEGEGGGEVDKLETEEDDESNHVGENDDGGIRRRRLSSMEEDLGVEEEDPWDQFAATLMHASSLTLASDAQGSENAWASFSEQQRRRRKRKTKKLSSPDKKKKIISGVKPKSLVVISLDRRCFDASPFVNDHPGGGSQLKRYAGRDASKAFDVYGHSEWAHLFMRRHLLVFDSIDFIGRYGGPFNASSKYRRRIRGSSINLDYGNTYLILPLLIKLLNSAYITRLTQVSANCLQKLATGGGGRMLPWDEPWYLSTMDELETLMQPPTARKPRLVGIGGATSACLALALFTACSALAVSFFSTA